MRGGKFVNRSYMDKRILLPVIGLVFLLSACHSFQAPQFRRVSNMRVAHWEFIQPVVAADVVYYNPNSIGFDFRGANVDVYLDSLWLGHTDIDTSIHCSAHSEFTIVLPVKLDLQRLIQGGLQTYLNRQVNVRVDGTVKGSKAGIMRSFPVHYEGTQELDLKLF